MKKVLAVSLAAVMTCSLMACGGNQTVEPTTAPPPAEAPAESQATETTPSAQKAPEDYTGTVVVYSPHDADPLNAGVNLFMETYPNVKVEVVAAGTGELCNRIAAESANPIADVLWGGGADSLAAFKEYFAPYVCANDDVIDDAYKDPEGLWIGESPLPMVIFYNKELLEKDGEFYVGLTIEKSAIQYAEDDTVGFSYPQDGTSAVPDGVALVKGAPNEENAKLFIDFVTGKECQTEQSQNWGRRPVRNDMEVGEGMAKLSDLVLVDYDFDWAANDKETIIEKFNDIMVN